VEGDQPPEPSGGYFTRCILVFDLTNLPPLGRGAGTPGMTRADVPIPAPARGRRWL